MLEIFQRLVFQCSLITGFVVFTATLQDELDFCHRNYREPLGKQEEAGEEQTKRTEVETNFPRSGAIVVAPARWHIVTIQRSNDNYETFEPHTNVHDDAWKGR